MRDWMDGGIKVWTTKKLLDLRSANSALFQQGTYTPCVTGGRYQRHALAFRRDFRGVSIAVVIPRLSALLGVPPLGLVWDDTTVDLGDTVGDWQDWFIGRRYPANNPLPLSTVFDELPYAVLVSR
jgi:(1->4)-alpha-D-glucan 1-alpha-D-glucosylmutase